MEGLKYDPNKLSIDGVKSQSGRVDDVEKAQGMAAIEAERREYAQDYRSYLADPGKYHSEHMPEFISPEDYYARVPNATAYPIPKEKTDREIEFGLLAKKGVSTEYLLRQGEFSAEIKGEAFDFQEKLKQLSRGQILVLKDINDEEYGKKRAIYFEFATQQNVDFNSANLLNARAEFSVVDLKRRLIKLELDQRDEKEKNAAR